MSMTDAGPKLSLKERHRVAAAEHLPPVRLVIGGEERDSGSGGTHEHINPSTGEVQATIPLAGASEVDEAVRAARAGLRAWQGVHPAERRDVLHRLAQLIREQEWSTLSVLENGQAMSFATLGAQFAPQYVSYYAGWADRIEGTVTHSSQAEGMIYTHPEPVGVVAVVVTWNGPHVSLGMKVPAILAAGNSIVLKMAEFTPFTVMRWVELARKAGLPDGVLNVVTGGPEAGRALVEHPGIDKITFTGGPATARAILHSAAETLTPALMELGGKGANMIFADANLDEAVPFSCAAASFISGQGCSLPTRMLVQREVYDEVVQRVEAVCSVLAVGDPLDPAVHIGPVINEASLNRILGIVERAKSERAGRLLRGGTRLGGELADGFFLDNTVFVDVDPTSSLAQDEVFGPVLSVIPFSTEEEAIQIANSTAYGLTNYIQTRDERRMRRMVEELRCGTIGINGQFCMHPTAPFGGVGVSGFGYEGGREGLDEFIHYKTVLKM